MCAIERLLCTFRIFFIFFSSGRGKGDPKRRGGGSIFIEIPRRGGEFSRRAEGPGKCLLRILEFGGGGG